jgi:16S rRNA (guanine1207-N2)-methyltransferase
MQGYRAMMTSQYFEPAPDTPSQPTQVRLDLADMSLHLTTDRGVFSHGAIDTGTRFLLQEAPAPGSIGTALDLGCGTGAIACALARRAPSATVWAVDVNERARGLTISNAAANACVNVQASAPDDVPADVVFDLIWSNPPIRIGKPALHGLLVTWLGRLSPTGRAVLVVQKHLGADSLASWIATQGYNVTRLASRQNFRLLQVTR